MTHAKGKKKQPSRSEPLPLRILVTGGAGFIGSHIVDALLQRPQTERVVVLDNFDTNYDPALKEANARIHKADRRYRLVRGDINDAALVRKVCKAEHFDGIVHLAAKADARKAVDTPQIYLETNILGSFNILECARECGIAKVVLASTSAVYGNTNKAPYKEDDITDFALTAYGSSKKAMEQLAFTYHHNHGLDITCVRIFNAYGPRMRPDLVLPLWVTAITQGTPIELSGKGTRKRDFTYVGDLADAFIRALQKPLGFAIVNVGNARPVALTELLRIVERTLKTRAQVVERPSHQGSVELTHANVSKAKRLLGWKPTTKLADGVAAYVLWLAGQRKK
jgi:UDP-glucuronate 4-epimerase